MFVKVDSDISVDSVREWPDPVLRDALCAIEVVRAELDSLQAVVLAESVGRGRVPETMFGSKVSVREATRRTSTAVALHDGSLPGAADALASGTVWGGPVCDPCHTKLTKDGYRLQRRNGTTYTYAADGTLIHTRTNRWRK